MVLSEARLSLLLCLFIGMCLVNYLYFISFIIIYEYINKLFAEFDCKLFLLNKLNLIMGCVIYI